MSLLTNSFFLPLYLLLLSHPIKTNDVLPLLPVYVSDLIITGTKPFSWATVHAHFKTSSRVSKISDAVISIAKEAGTKLCLI